MGFSSITTCSNPIFLVCLMLTFFFTIAIGDASSRSTYLVHMDSSSKPSSFLKHDHWYQSLVASAMDMPEEVTDFAADNAAGRILYSYDSALHGFAAHLTNEEARRLELSYGVVEVRPEMVYHLHTTRSPQFLGLETAAAGAGADIWSAAAANHDVIVGVLDTGIWLESPSFNDRGMAPVPARWKGLCEVGHGFNGSGCNRKVIGARMFYRGYEAASGAINDKGDPKSPRDSDGHGSHTAATVAGAAVPGANLLGYASGTARGMAPNARVAAYKVCWTGGCFSSDILSAVDRAVADGVDVLSISLGGGIASYSRDSLSIATFGAMQMGVFVSCSAGNGGPDPISLTNVSPWITTVGASTMDRDFPSAATLGDGRVIAGVSLYRGRRNLSPTQQYPLVYLGSNSSNADPRSLCLEGTLDPRSVAGKIVICDRGISARVQKGQVVKDAGGVGMILANTAVNGEELVADCHLLPAVAVGAKSGRAVKAYAKTARRPTATLTFSGTKLGVKPSPVVAAFSSRGPNFLTLEVLKPDVVAPGVNILAAWTGAAAPSGLSTDPRRVGYNILSGTSMSCPHVSGVAALLKASHTDWSPAAIKSALMTTAYVDDNTNSPLRDAATCRSSSPFDHGAGHIDPAKALNPGLVYDINGKDYLDFLCTQKLTPLQLRSFTKTAAIHNCNNTSFKTAGDLNYPALSVVFADQRPASSVTLRRTATNVGSPASSYKVTVSQFKGAAVVIEPAVLHFTAKNQRLTYRVTFTTKLPQPSPEFGALVWTDGVHNVRSPIVLTWLPPLEESNSSSLS